jgi:hypothetical protein
MSSLLFPLPSNLILVSQHFFEPRKMSTVLMRGNERLSGLHQRTQDPVNVSSGIMEAVGPGFGHKKGKRKKDEVYRLFVLSF